MGINIKKHRQQNDLISPLIFKARNLDYKSLDTYVIGQRLVNLVAVTRVKYSLRKSLNVSCSIHNTRYVTEASACFDLTKQLSGNNILLKFICEKT
jgi:hypothetical protein